MLNSQGFPILEVTDLIKRADGVTFSISDSEILGLVGESSCGKTTLGKIIPRLHTKHGGIVKFKGEDIFQRRRHLSMVEEGTTRQAPSNADDISTSLRHPKSKDESHRDCNRNRKIM